jgi:VCBS repeat-containing protein
MLPATTRILTALLAALLLSHASTARAAVTQKDAERKALNALGVEKGSAPVVVFRLGKPVRAGARISQAGTARQPSGGSITTKAAPALLRMRESAYFFFADQMPYAAYQHIGWAVLVGTRSGKVRISKRLMWPPLIDNRVPAFLKSEGAYDDPANRAFERTFTTTPATASAVPDGLVRGRAAQLLAQDRACVVEVSDTLGDQYAFGPTDRTRTRLGALFAGLHTPAQRYRPSSGTTPARFSDRVVAQRGCKDVLLYIAGGAWASGRDPAISVGVKPGPGARIRQQLVRASDVRSVLRAHRDTTFSILADAPYAAGFVNALKREPNARLVKAPSGLTGMLELTNRMLDGVDRVLACRSMVDAASAAGSFLAELIERSLNGASCTFGGVAPATTLPNHAPAASATAVTTNEDEPVAIPVHASDPDGDALTTSTTPPEHGTLAGLTYTPARDFNGTDSFELTVGDGRGGTASATVTVTVTPVDDSATITTSGSELSYTEDDPATAVDPGLALSDVDDDELDGATVRIAHGLQPGDELRYSGPLASTYANGVLTLTGTASLVAYEEALRSVEYVYTGDDPSAAKTVSFEAGGGAAAREIAVTALPDAPVLTTSAGSAAFTEGAGPVAIDDGLTISDADSPTLSSAVVEIAGGFVPGQDTLGFTDQNGITHTYADGTLTLTGVATVAQYQAALRSVTFGNGSQSPSTAARTITFQVRDLVVWGSKATRGVTVAAVSDPSVITTSAGALAYIEGDPATAIDPGLTLTDPDSTQLTGATVRIASGRQAEDVLSLTGQAQITGAFDGETLTLSGAASLADYQVALRSVRYRHTGDDPVTAKTIEFSAGGGSATKAIAITPVNDAPQLTNTAGALSYTENASAAAIDNALTVADPDSQIAGATVTVSSATADDRLAFSSQLGITGSYAAGTLTLSGTASPANYQTALRSVTYANLSDSPPAARTITFQVTDGAVQSNAATRGITITATNDAPSAVADTGTTDEDHALNGSTVLANDTDPDSGDTKTVTRLNGSATLTGTSPKGAAVTSNANGAYTYDPRGPFDSLAPGQSDTDAFSYTMRDAAGATATATVTLTITGVDDGPIAVNDSFDVIGNTSLYAGTTRPAAEPAKAISGSLLANDTDPDSPAASLSVQPVTDAPTTLGGTITIEADGNFTYRPDDGDTGVSDTFTYTLTDGMAAATGTLTLPISGQVWYVKSGASGDGTSDGPFGTLAAAQTASGTGDTVYILAGGSLAGGYTLDSSERLIGEAAGLSVDGVQLHAAGTRPGLTGGISGGAGVDGATIAGLAAAGLDLDGTTGTTSVSDLSVTTTGATGIHLNNAGTVNVSSTSVTTTGAPAIDATGTTGTLAFGNVSSTNSPTSGIHLAGAGAFSATSGTIAGAGGIAFDVDGGSGNVTYAGALNDGAGQTARIINRTGGAVTLSGSIADSSDTGGGITLSGNSAGSTTFSGASKVLNTGTADAIAMSASDGHTLNLTGGGLDIDATSGRGLAATSSGTLSVTGSGNTIDTTTGRALTITNTDIAAAGATFQRISANGAGILLDTTGGAGGLTVTGTGGTCTPANTSGCSGGEIRNAAGADDSGSTPVGSGIVLKDTAAPSLTRVYLHDHANYAIRGTNVAGFTLADSVINGANGTNATTPFDDSAVWFTNLTGSASVARTAVSGGYEDNFRVSNSSGSLNRITFDAVTMGLTGTANGNDSLSLQSQATAGQLHATIQNSTFTGAPGDLIDYQHNGSGTGDLVLTGNAFSNNHPAIATGGGGLTLSNAGTSGATTMDIENNSFRDAVGTGVLIVKTAGPATQTGTFSNNTIGVAGVANSGSKEGSGLGLQLVDQGSDRWTVANNQIRGYNNNGITVTGGGGSTVQSGAINATITGNTIAEPGTTPGTLSIPKQGVHFNIGTFPGDTFQACAVISGNTLASSGADGVPATGIDADVRLRQRQSSTIRLPGYAGSATDTAAVQSFVAANNTGASVLASVNSPPGGGFTGAGTTCP